MTVSADSTEKCFGWFMLYLPKFILNFGECNLAGNYEVGKTYFVCKMLLMYWKNIRYELEQAIALNSRDIEKNLNCGDEIASKLFREEVFLRHLASSADKNEAACNRFGNSTLN
jgi:hypothetical protein